MKIAKRTVARVQWHAATKQWVVTVGGHVFAPCDAKAHLVKRAALHMRRLHELGGFNAQLVVHGKDGRIQFERTYGADPKRSKG